jgi:hypothetical protein
MPLSDVWPEAAALRGIFSKPRLLGICARYHFSRTFRRERRLPPAALRKRGIW